ncbi:MAG: TldD/PmbA family protein [Candidatus Sumerlaeia bacterium]|nr:TldD/PmbA family protein [Candidatus Sumerlaeia bacterium]
MKTIPSAVRESLTEILKRSSADQTELLFIRTAEGLTRFSRNYIHQNTWRTNQQLNLRLIYGKKIGSFSTNRLDREGIDFALKQTEEIARHQQEDKMFKSLPASKSTITDTKSMDEHTAQFTPAQRVAFISSLIKKLSRHNIEANGSFTTRIIEMAVINSCGINSYFITTVAEMNVVAERDKLSAYAYRVSNRVLNIKPEDIADELLPKLLITKSKVEMKPGNYVVVLEPYAVASLLGFLGFVGFGALAYLEGLSFMSTKKGHSVAHKMVNIYDDGYDSHTLHQPFDYEGVKKQKVLLIKNGIATNVVYDSRTAGMKRGAKNTGHALPAPNSYGPLPLNIIMTPGKQTLNTIIRDIDYGIYVTRFHYVNVVEQISTVITGMTRDGAFLIQKGKLQAPIVDMRFTQSILGALKNIKAISSKAQLCDSILGATYAPALCIADFTFTGKTM